MADAATRNEAGPTEGWTAAAGLLGRWLDRHERVDELLQGLSPRLPPEERARCRNLFYGVIRHYGRLHAELAALVAHPPRLQTRAVLYLAGFEILEARQDPADPGRPARIVHHAVERAKQRSSPAEAKFVNAVVRRLATRLEEPVELPRLAGAAEVARIFSHPEWLVRRWFSIFGADATRRLLEWNQQPARTHARWRSPEPVPDWLRPTPWAGFFAVVSGHWNDVEAALAAGRLYLQDPASRIPVELLAPRAGATVLDACAAPGGKSLLIADTLLREAETASVKAGRVIALDLPGPRLDRLRENLSRVRGVDTDLVAADLSRGIRAQLRKRELPVSYDAILLDAPCSNTGVMRHRVDVKWRLQEGDFGRHARQQRRLLEAAAELVAPGGRLVYATCSIDPEENGRIVKHFLEGKDGNAFRLKREVISLPWECGHDGGGAFLLQRT